MKARIAQPSAELEDEQAFAIDQKIDAEHAVEPARHAGMTLGPPDVHRPALIGSRRRHHCSVRSRTPSIPLHRLSKNGQRPPVPRVASYRREPDTQRCRRVSRAEAVRSPCTSRMKRRAGRRRGILRRLLRRPHSNCRHRHSPWRLPVSPEAAVQHRLGSPSCSLETAPQRRLA